MRLAELDHPSVHPAIHFGNRSLSDYRLRLAAVLRFFKRTVIGVGAQSRQTALPHLQKGILKRFRNQTVPQRRFSFRRRPLLLRIEKTEAESVDEMTAASSSDS